MDLTIDVNSVFQFLYTDERSRYREIIITGGRGSSKTYSIRQFFTIECLMNKRIFFIFRETRDMIKESREDFVDYLDDSGIKYTLDSMIENIDTAKGEPITIKNEIIKFFNGSTIVFSFINDNVAKKRKSLRGMNGAWIDEAHYITEYTHMNLLPSIRGFEDSFIIYTFNPQKEDDFLYKRAKNYKSDRLKTLHINYDKNIFFPSVMEEDRIDDYRNLPRDLYNHIWLGEPLHFNDLQVIDVSKLKYFDDTDKNADRYYSQLYISCDTAYSVKEHADYSVLSLIGFDRVSSKYHFLRMMRGQWDFNDLVSNLKSLYFYAVETYNGSCDIFIENKASGQSLIQEIARMTNLPIYPILPKGDKAQRLVLCLKSIYEDLLLPSDRENPLNQWVMEVLKEFKEFRMDMKHKHDDIIDTITQLFNYLNDVVDYTKIS